MPDDTASRGQKGCAGPGAVHGLGRQAPAAPSVLLPEARQSLRSQPEQAPAAWIDRSIDQHQYWWGGPSESGLRSGCRCSGVCRGHILSTAWVQSALLSAPSTLAP